MQTIIDYGTFIIAWIITLVRLYTITKKGLEKHNKLVLKPWLFSLFLSLFITFQVDSIYTYTNSITGINNLAWLLSYIFMAPTAYFICASFYKPPRWMQFHLLITLAAIIIIFPFGPGIAKETVDHITPSNIGELLFVVTMYTYATITLAVVPIPANIKALQKETELPTRIRASMTLLALNSIIISYIIKLIVFTSSFFFPLTNKDFISYATDTSRFFVGITAFSWPVIFISNKIYWYTTEPKDLVKQIQTIRQLQFLRSRLEYLCPDDESTPPRPQQNRIGKLDSCIYRKAISVMDKEAILVAWLRQGGKSHWDDHKMEEAILIARILQEIPNSSDFESLVEGYCNASKQLKRMQRKIWVTPKPVEIAQ
jgi:hypothetical protein